MLSQDQYFDVLRVTPLTSIDLFLFHNNKLWLGKRTNEPAKGTFFTPGCKGHKYESQEQLAKRVAESELGITINFNKCKLIGVYDHTYYNNFRDASVGTHYVNCAYIYKLSDNDISSITLDHQHIEYIWLSIEDAISQPDVHNHVKITLYDIAKHRNDFSSFLS